MELVSAFSPDPVCLHIFAVFLIMYDFVSLFGIRFHLASKCSLLLYIMLAGHDGAL